MSDKKIIIIAIILALIVIGGGWYFYTHNAQKTSVSVSPKTPLAQVTEPGIVYGNPAAPVTIEEYTNFLCPACARFASETFGSIKDNYITNGKVKMVFFIFPPMETARAGLCANEQGKFIEYHDYVLSHQNQITGENVLKDFAVNAGLDSQKFNACYDTTDKYQATVQKWSEEGAARGVDATPIFFINGQKLIGAQSYAEFQKIIDQKLGQ